MQPNPVILFAAATLAAHQPDASQTHSTIDNAEGKYLCNSKMLKSF
jgi:hypothetical protein